jgi:SAM-dependent methyltransferase
MFSARASMAPFIDRFAFAAGDYASFRPHYPAALVAWLRQRLPAARRVWDCGTGSGQAAVALASAFPQVVASDPSLSQLAHAEGADRVAYVAMTAEQSALRDGSIDLVTVAQALHWFDRTAFFAEVKRVLAPGGLLAVWSYGVCSIEPSLDEVLHHFHDVTVGPYWSPARRLVESGYAGIEFPFNEERVPAFPMVASWSLAQLGGYLSTWSAVGKYREVTGSDPMPAVMQALAERWGEPGQRRQIQWPLYLRVGTPR